MIYVVSDRIDVSGQPDMRALSVDRSKEMIRGWPVVQYDSETPGLDCHCFDRPHSMQFGYKDFATGRCDQVVVDCRYATPEEYRDVLESSYLIGHNLKFDLKWLYNYGIVPSRIYDTMICEQVLYLGYSPKEVSFNLHDVLYRRTGVELDKSMQRRIARSGLTMEGIRYAAGDVVHLQDIRRSQMLEAKGRDCLGAFALESEFVRSVAYLEWCGIKLDEKAWREKMEKDRRAYDDCLAKLDRYVEGSPVLRDKFTSQVSEPDLFSQGDEDRFPCTVNWKSPQQVIDVCKALGFKTMTLDRKKHKERDSVLEDVLKCQKGIADDFLDMYFAFKAADKNVTSYGRGHLNSVNPNTGRIHTEFRQIGTITGRMSSGSLGKNNDDLARMKGLPVRPSEAEKRKGLGCPYPNMQQLPHEGTVRSCFISEPGNVFVSCDYSAEESRVQADVWNEPKLLDCFAKGIDTHNLYAKIFFPSELKDCDVKDVKKLHPDLRQRAKGAEFKLTSLRK